MVLLLKNLLFTLVVPGTVGVYVPLLLARDRPPASGLVFLLALALLAMGGAMYAWCVWDFATFGRGTPAAIDAPKRLVVRGLYQYTRNPMYVGVLTLLIGWTVMFQATTLLIYTFCVGIAFHLFVVFYEERRLRQQFGAEYHDYCGYVGRWLPRFRRRQAL
ncbi:MAG: isoprenylcysteine carboxylmethyltransferase family protein [Deltaproteobacteria bacterium]|nr:isoprenylcysteine carboxylmethyltransferase family protein [Deltaproteobacteria bacterium]